MTNPTTPTGASLRERVAGITQCKHCGGKSLTWDTFNKIKSNAPQGRLRANEVECVFVLGCDDCSETLFVVSADRIARMLMQAPTDAAKAAARIASLEAELNKAIQQSLPRRIETDRLRNELAATSERLEGVEGILGIVAIQTSVSACKELVELALAALAKPADSDAQQEGAGNDTHDNA